VDELHHCDFVGGVVPAPGPQDPIDRVDELNAPVGVVRRGDVFSVGANFRVVHVLLLGADSTTVLVQQLGHARERHPLLWGSSVAGYLHVSESAEDGANRRLGEELGLVLPLRCIGWTHMFDNGVKKFIAVFTGVSDSAQINEPEHIESLRFIPLRELERAVSDGPQQFTETFLHVFEYYMTSRHQ
jgi:isopentenyl-diphosphate Delta-isomerase